MADIFTQKLLKSENYRTAKSRESEIFKRMPEILPMRGC